MTLNLTRMDPDSADAFRELEARVIALETAPSVGADIVQKQVVHYKSGLVVTYEKASSS